MSSAAQAVAGQAPGDCNTEESAPALPHAAASGTRRLAALGASRERLVGLVRLRDDVSNTGPDRHHVRRRSGRCHARSWPIAERAERR